MGAECDDGEACTVLDTCDSAGQCAGIPDATACPCSDDDDCLEQDPDGDACDDRYRCLPIEPGSAAKACIYSDEPTLCEQPESGCALLSCEALSGECLPSTFLEAGTPCEDADPCTKGDSCDGMGGCIPGYPDAVTCSCTKDSDCLGFDLDDDACNGRHLCTDLGWATGDHACTYEPTPVECPEPSSPCLQAVCVPSSGLCVDSAVDNGLACDDDNLCSSESSCQFGICTGSDWKSCLAEGPCDNPACDPSTGSCYLESVSEDCCGNQSVEGDEECDTASSWCNTAASWCTAECTATSCVPGSLALGSGCLRIETGGGLGATFTLDFFIRAQEAPGSVLASGEGLNGPWGLSLEVQGAQRVLVWHETSTAGGTLAVQGPPLEAGQWQYLTLVRDATSPSGVEVTFWLDGVHAGSETFLSAPFEHAAWAWLGCTGGSASVLPALIDEFRWREGVHEATTTPTSPLTSAGASILYHFDDVTPGVAVDASGWGRHGAWQGCLRTDETPLIEDNGSCEVTWCQRSGLIFEANQEGVGIAPPSALVKDITELTVEFYLRLDATEATQFIVGHNDGVVGGADWHIQSIPAGGGLARLQWVEGQDAGGVIALDNTITSETFLTKGVTYHAAFVRSLEGDAFSGRWHIDGKAGASAPLQSPKTFELSTRPLYLGSQGGSADFLEGFLDELRLSRVALYGEDDFVPGALDAGPDTLALFHFDIGSGQWAYPELWGVYPPMALQGISYDSQGAAAAGPCP